MAEKSSTPEAAGQTRNGSGGGSKGGGGGGTKCEAMDRQWCLCGTDAGLKTTGGTLLGGLWSLMMTSQRPWPAILGAGIGLGFAYINCEKDMNKLLTETQ